MDNNIFSHLGNIVETNAVTVTPHEEKYNLYNAQILKEKTKLELVNIALNEFGVELPFRMLKKDMIQEILDEQTLT